MTPTLLAIDQGTTSTRAILFGVAGEPLHAEQRELRQIYPQDGWIEHDPEEICQDTLAVCRAVLAKADAPPAAIGITNQRETTVLWDRATGRAVYNAIVWQDRRGADHCARNPSAIQSSTPHIGAIRAPRRGSEFGLGRVGVIS